MSRRPKREALDIADVDVNTSTWHVGCGLPGHFPHLEQRCPCPKAPCGLAEPHPQIPCPDHQSGPIRQAHRQEECLQFRTRAHRPTAHRWQSP